MTVGVNTNYYNPYQYQPVGLNSIQPGNVNFQAGIAKPVEKKDAVADGKDDGSIGFWKAAGHVLKGAAKFFTGMFTDKEGNFSLWQTLKTAATVVGIGAICVFTAGTAVPALLMAGGIAVSGVGVAKSAINMATADTDAEMIAACESFGSNSVALGLSVAGAKATARGAHAAEAAAGEFDGVSGTWNAVKTTFSDAYKPVGNSFKGVVTEYKNGSGVIDSAKGAASKFGENVSAEFKGFKTTVGKNTEALLNTKTNISQEANALDKEKASLEERISKETDPAKQAKLKADKEIVEAKQQAMREMNDVTSWEEGNAKLQATESELETARAEVKNATTDAAKKTAKAKVKKLEAQQKAQRRVLERRTAEAQHLRDQIAAKEKQLKAAREAETPDAAKIANLQSELNALKGKEGAEFLPEEHNIEQYKAYLEDLKKDYNIESNETWEAQLKNMEIENNVATSGGARTHYINELRPQIINNNLNYKTNPTSWLTVGIAGRNDQTNAEAELYSMLTPQEKAYVKSLDAQQKEALIQQYRMAS